MILMGSIDLLIDYRISFSIFYVLPVVLVTWHAGFKSGILFSILSTFFWLFAAVVSKYHQIPLAILFWNSTVRFGFFIIIVMVLHYFKSERENARVDFLTKIPNRRYFEESLMLEIQRSRRYNHPMTMAYMDVDDFKLVNDTIGHQEGDKLLKTVSRVIRDSMRASDMIARLGGDEFAMVFVETGQKQARAIVNKLKDALLLAMQGNMWPVTFSFGVVTFYNIPDTPREMMRIADGCMYDAKKSGKNKIITRTVK